MKLELDKYKHIIEQNNIDTNTGSGKTEFIQNENFMFGEWSNLITERKELLNMPFFYQLTSSYGPTSASRIKFINDWFDNIIDYCISDDFKIWYTFHK